MKQDYNTYLDVKKSLNSFYGVVSTIANAKCLNMWRKDYDGDWVHTSAGDHYTMVGDEYGSRIFYPDFELLIDEMEALTFRGFVNGNAASEAIEVLNKLNFILEKLSFGNKNEEVEKTEEELEKFLSGGVGVVFGYELSWDKFTSRDGNWLALYRELTKNKSFLDVDFDFIDSQHTSNKYKLPVEVDTNRSVYVTKYKIPTMGTSFNKYQSEMGDNEYCWNYTFPGHRGELVTKDGVKVMPLWYTNNR